MSIFEPDNRPKDAWPSNGIDFNRWFTGLHRFIVMLKHFEWYRASGFKYVNIRVDTRNGYFIVLSDPNADGNRRRVDPDEIAKHVDMNAVDAELVDEIGLDHVVKFDDCDTAEPTLRKMILSYYIQGLNPDYEEAKKRADAFIEALTKRSRQ